MNETDERIKKLEEYKLMIENRVNSINKSISAMPTSRTLAQELMALSLGTLALSVITEDLNKINGNDYSYLRRGL